MLEQRGLVTISVVVGGLGQTLQLVGIFNLLLGFGEICQTFSRSGWNWSNRIWVSPSAGTGGIGQMLGICF